MALAAWQSTITDAYGNVVAGAKVEIRREDNLAALASLKTDRAGATPAGNPVTADANGFVRVFMLGGAYRIKPMDAAMVQIGEPLRYVPVGTAGERDDSEFVSTSVQHSHPSAAKAWVKFTGTGTPTIQDSYNVASITDNGVGDYTVAFATPFSSAHYCVVAMCQMAAANTHAFFASVEFGGQLAGSVRIKTGNPVTGPQDAAAIYLTAFGDQ